MRVQTHNLCEAESISMEGLPDFNLIEFSFADLTSGEDLKMSRFSQGHEHFWSPRGFLIAFRFLK